MFEIRNMSVNYNTRQTRIIASKIRYIHNTFFKNSSIQIVNGRDLVRFGASGKEWSGTPQIFGIMRQFVFSKFWQQTYNSRYCLPFQIKECIFFHNYFIRPGYTWCPIYRSCPVAHFGPKYSFWGSRPEVLGPGGPQGTGFVPNYSWLIRMDWNIGYQILRPGIKSLRKGPNLAHKSPGGPGGIIWSQLPSIGTTGLDSRLLYIMT